MQQTVTKICGLWINLDTATERRQAMEIQLELAGLVPEYQRITGTVGTSINSNLPRPGVIGCWLSHLQALQQGQESGFVVHIMEDDTWLGNGAKDLFYALADSAALAQYDLIFTDVLFDYLTTQRYFRAFYEAAAQIIPGAIPPQIHTIDLHQILIAGMNSYFIHPAKIARVFALLDRAYQTIDPDHPEPIDMVMRRLIQTGELRAAVTCPFITSYQLQSLADTQIENPTDLLLHRARWLESIHRQAFFYGANDDELLTQLATQFPVELSSKKSRLLGLLYEQFLIQAQQSF
jgi:GR25 family glycosyltransferase involved in LPS biosynthesis